MWPDGKLGASSAPSRPAGLPDRPFENLWLPAAAEVRRRISSENLRAWSASLPRRLHFARAAVRGAASASSRLRTFLRPAGLVLLALLGLGVLLLSGLCLLAVMRAAGWSWNLPDLMAIPLVLGTGVDYSLLMQLALRRYHGDLAIAYRSVGRALLLCGGTAAAAFGSLAWSTNSGMASLGQLCAVGIALNMFIAIFLLPVWWHKAAGPIRSTRST